VRGLARRSEIFIANRYLKNAVSSVEQHLNRYAHRSWGALVCEVHNLSPYHSLKYAAPTELVAFETPIAINISLLRSWILVSTKRLNAGNSQVR
jgi:hypothetical protein